MKKLIIFDLDGVITSEDCYWDCAGLTLHELLYSPRYWNLGNCPHSCDEPLERNVVASLTGDKVSPGYSPPVTAVESRAISRAVLPESEILALKARAVNSNWDTCYIAVCLHLIDALALLPDYSGLLPLGPWNAQWLTRFRLQMECKKGSKVQQARGFSLLDTPPFRGYTGFGLINRLDVYASDVLCCPIEDVFSRQSPFWPFCRDIFQEWYLGDILYLHTYGRAPVQTGKPGCIHFEQPLLPVKQVRATLATLCQQGYMLGIATGRPRYEAFPPLQEYGLLEYFDEQHIAPYDYVERAETALRADDDQTLLGKPHPFPFLIAADPGYQYQEGQEHTVSHESVIVVGDSTSDILGGRAAGAMTIAVFTGARTPEARTLLRDSGPDYIIDDMTQLPALLQCLNSEGNFYAHKI